MHLIFAIFPFLAAIDPGILNEQTPFSPPYHFEERYWDVKMDFGMRWEKFAEGKEFVLWTPGRSDESLAEEFARVKAMREDTWFVDKGVLRRSDRDFVIAEDLIAHDCVRESNCIPFEYNRACSYYNGSLVQSDQRRLIAMMGPREKDVHSFFRLLMDASVSALVRLTPAWEGEVSKCYPYWEERVEEGYLQIPLGKKRYPIRYFAIDNWIDNQGNEPIELYRLVQEVRKGHDPSTGPLAVHCTNGVGRTGTVVAAIALLDEAEKQIHTGVNPKDISVSVEETVLRFSLQRFFMCAQIPQYQSLYRILELYVNSFGDS